MVRAFALLRVINVIAQCCLCGAWNALHQMYVPPAARRLQGLPPPPSTARTCVDWSQTEGSWKFLEVEELV